MKGNIEKIYGVNLVGSQDPNALIRVDDAVGLNITVGTSEITSDFDSCYPWSDIEEVTDKFGNVFVKIPKFYSKITKNSDGTYKHQLSGTKHEGFDTLFKVGEKEIDYVMVGKYEGGGSSFKVCSKSGQTPLVNTTMDQFRNGCKANGAGYQQYDFLIDLIIKELWLVEMKTTNCQSIMYGYVVGNQFKEITGTTDSVSTPSGSPVSNTDGRHACKYRGIENPWGNVWKWCDGISFSGSSVYVCTEPTAYSAGKTTGLYELYGSRASSGGYVKTVAPLAEGSLVQYVTAVGGDRNTYYCDSSVEGGTVLACGGGWSNGGVAGLWCWNGLFSASTSHPDFCGRLCYKPVASFNPLRNRLNCMVKSNSTMLDCVGLPMFPLATTTTEAFYLQPASWTDSETGDLTKYGNTELEYLNYPHPFDTLTGEQIRYDNINEYINTKNQRIIGECCLQSIATLGWQPQTWTGLTDFNGGYVWTDGARVYYSSSSKQYQLEPYTSVWTPKKWQGPLNYFDLDGKNIWSDGSTIYYSASVEEQYELVPNTSTWILKTWKGFTPLQGENIWTDGTNIYYSTKTKVNYQLDKTTSTWNKKTWGGLLTDFEGKNVWTDGENIYYSYGNFQYQLDKSTSTWNQKTWNGLRSFNGSSIWTDGTSVYSSAGQYHYQLDTSTSNWRQISWTGLVSFEGLNVWTANNNVYYSLGEQQYKLQVPKTNQYNVWTDLKRVQIVTPAGPRVVQTQEPAKWDDTKFWVEGWDDSTDTHMAQVKRHPQLTNKTLNIDCYMTNIDDLYTGLETCTLSYEDGPDGNSGTWFLKKPDGSTYITLKVTQTQKQEGQS